MNSSDQPQLTRADLAGMSSEQIAEARRDGRLNVLLGSQAPTPTDQHITRDDLTRMHAEHRYDEISQLHHDGRLDHLLDPTNTTEPED